MKVCFIGLGSIAGRHIKNLHSIFHDDIHIDVMRHSQNATIPEDLKLILRNCYASYEELPADYDVIFITNPTKLHYQTLQAVSGHARNFFIEKPVFEDGTEDLDKLGLQKDAVYYVACPLRYTNVIQYLKQNINFKDVYSMRCISSSYLPDWRPGVDYRNTYSARKDLGGGVSIDLIHEWDYISYLVGTPLNIKSIISKKSCLEIDSDDIAVYIAEYSDKIIELHLDYFGRVPCRKIDLFMKDEVVQADLINQKVVYLRKNQTIDLSEDRDSFQQKELKYFFDIVLKKKININTLEDACRTLRITKALV